jgi:hypothetical protein
VAEEDAGHAVDREQPLGERRLRRRRRIAQVERAVAEDGTPGRNLSVAGFGVVSVWMNMSVLCCGRPKAGICRLMQNLRLPDRFRKGPRVPEMRPPPFMQRQT